MGYFDEPEENEFDKYMRKSIKESLHDPEIGYKGFCDAEKDLKKYKSSDEE